MLRYAWSRCSPAYKQWRQLGFDLSPIGSSGNASVIKTKIHKRFIIYCCQLIERRAHQTMAEGEAEAEAVAKRIDSTGFGRLRFGMQLKTSAAAVARAMPRGYCKSRRALERNCNKGNTNSNSNSNISNNSIAGCRQNVLQNVRFRMLK